ncbi:MAG TPA: sensor histidine kinase [Candidatus Limnocylindrales bacterium]|nr:sensor histidine kinase [Candidatus Limnocylindrales bacterium]
MGELRSKERVPTAVLPWLAALMLLLGVVAALLAFSGWTQERTAKAEEARILARAAANDINRFLASQLATVQGIAAADAVVDADVGAMSDLFDRVNPSRLGFDGQIFWVDSDGMMRARSAYDGEPLDFSDREWVQRVLASGAPYVSNARIGQLSDAPIVVFAVPTYGRDGAQSGVLGAAMRLDRVRRDTFGLGTAGGTAVVMMDRVGQIVASREPVASLAPAATGFDFEGLRAAGEGVLTDAVGPTGETDRLVGYAAVPAGEWLLVIDQAQRAAFGAAQARLVGQLALIAGFTTLAVIVAVWSSRRAARALERQEAALAAEHEANARLADLVDQLREREELREAFVGVLSHELRTPATTIYGMTAVLARSPDREDRQAIVEDIRDEADRLNRIIEDLLVLSRAERKVLSVGEEPVLVQRLVPSVAMDLARRFSAVTLETDVPDTLPPVAADDGALRQVLFNLLSNAAKYGAGSPVRLEGRAVGDRVRLVVADLGPGFPPEDAERLFDLYYRSARTSRQAAGTGIGLFVVRQLVEAMRGRVEAEAPASGGARFTVTLETYGRDAEGEGDMDRPGAEEGDDTAAAAPAERPAEVPGRASA